MDEPEDHDPMTLDPVAIVLTRIEAGPTVRFIGADIGTGAAVTVVVETQGPHQSLSSGPVYEASGLVLLLTIEPVTAIH